MQSDTVPLPTDKVSAMSLKPDESIAASHATDRHLLSLVGRPRFTAICISSGRLPSNKVLAAKGHAASVNLPARFAEAC